MYIYKKLGTIRTTFNIMPFKYGVSKDTKATNETNIKLAQMANEANRQIAHDTNQTNITNTQATNSANIQMNEANNMLQRQLQAEMNAYNDIGAQLERAKKAGVNPNAVIQGSLSGNLQTSLPSTSAGHADAPLAQIGNPMVAPRVENPYMERLATVEQLRGITNDFFSREQVKAQTEQTKAQTIGQYKENNFIDDLRGLQLSLGRAQEKQIYTSIGNMYQEREVMLENINQTKANIANMNERTRAQFIDNYFKEDSRKTFRTFVRETLDSKGIPRKNQLSDDSIDGIYFGALQMYNIPLSQLENDQVQRAVGRADVRVKGAMQGLIGAQTQGQYYQNFLNQTFGFAERSAGLDETDSRTNKNNHDVKVEKWMETPWAQTQFAGQCVIQTMQMQSNVENTNADTFNKRTSGVKNMVESVGAGVGSFLKYAR